MIWREDVMVSVVIVVVSLVFTVPSHFQINRHRFVGDKKVYNYSDSSEVIMVASVPILEQKFVLQWTGMY